MFIIGVLRNKSSFEGALQNGLAEALDTPKSRVDIRFDIHCDGKLTF